MSRQSSTFEASTTVFVSQALPDGASAFDVGPLVSDFQKAVTLPQVRQSVADKLQLPVDEIEVVATRNGTDGGSVEVVAEAGNGPDAEAISRSVSTEAMRYLAERNVDRARSEENARQVDVDEAMEAREAVLTESGNPGADPRVTYADTQERLNRLNLDKIDPTVAKSSEVVAALDALTASLRSQLPAQRAAAQAFEIADTELTEAQEALNDARMKRVSAEETLNAATTDVAIAAGETEEASKLATMLQAFVAAVVATFVAGIAFFFIADGARNRPSTASVATMPVAPRNPRPANPKDSPAGAAATTARTGGATGGTVAPASEPSRATTPAATDKVSSTTANGTSSRASARAQPPATLEAMEAALDAEFAKANADAATTAVEPKPAGAKPARPAGEAVTKSGSADASGTTSMFSRPAEASSVATTTADPADAASGAARARRADANRRRLPGS